jgi:hypothetical protein
VLEHLPNKCEALSSNSSTTNLWSIQSIQGDCFQEPLSSQSLWISGTVSSPVGSQTSLLAVKWTCSFLTAGHRFKAKPWQPLAIRNWNPHQAGMHLQGV